MPARKPSENENVEFFREIPADWNNRWRLIRKFVQRWFEVSLPDVGEPIPEIPREQQSVRSGRNPMTGKEFEIWEFPPIDRVSSAAWPPSAREWFSFVRQLHRSRSTTWPPIALPDLFFEASTAHEHVGGPEELVLMHVESFRGAYVIPRTDWNDPDPPVSFADRTSDSTQPRCFPHVTTFVIWYLFECSTVGPNGLSDRIRAKSSKRLLHAINEAFPIQSTWDDLRLFERKDVVAMIGPVRLANPRQDHLHVLARTPKAVEFLETLRAIL